MEWKTVKLGEVCDRVCSGGTPNSRNNKYYDGGIPWLNTKEIDFGRIYSTERTISQEGLENSSAKWIDENSVIVAMYGATAGKVAVSKIRLTTNQACCNLHIDEKKADYNYVYYYLLNNFSILASLANGGAQQNLNAQIIKDFLISLPPLETQRRIAAILSSLDDKIENNNRINRNLEAQAQALFKSWFVDFEPFGGTMPEDWKEGSLGEIANFKRGKGILGKDARPGSIPVVAGGIEPAYYHDTANTKAPVITISASGANAGYVRLYNEDIWASDCSWIDASSKNLLWVYCYLSINRHILRHAQTGAVQPHVKAKDVNAFEIIVPVQKVIEDFIEVVKPLFDQIAINQRENSRLAALRDTLLPKLMKGEIEV